METLRKERDVDFSRSVTMVDERRNFNNERPEAGERPVDGSRLKALLKPNDEAEAKRKKVGWGSSAQKRENHGPGLPSRESEPEEVNADKLKSLCELTVEPPHRRNSPTPRRSVQATEPTIPEETDGKRLTAAIRKLEANPPKIEIPPSAPVMLGVRRSTPAHFQEECAECRKSTMEMFVYGESNKDRVVLCEGCNAAALDRSFGQDDMLDHAIKQSGKAAANRPTIRPWMNKEK